MSEQTLGTPAARTPRPTPPGVFAWFVFLAVGGLFIGSIAVARSRHADAVGKWRDEMRPKRDDAIRFGRRLNAMKTELKSWDEVERDLGMKLAQGAKVHADNPSHRVGVVTDPASGFTFDLRFYDDELRDVHPRPVDGPPMDDLPRVLDGIRLWLARVGWFVWLLLIAHLLMTGRRRRVLSQVLLGLSLLLFAAIVLEDYPSSPWYRFLVRWWSALAVLMPILSVMTLVGAYRTRDWPGGFPAVAPATTPAPAEEAGGFQVEDDEEREEEAGEPAARDALPPAEGETPSDAKGP